MKYWVLIILICSCSMANAQDYIKVNPIRAFLGEVQFSYEKSRKDKRKAIEYKVGLVYPGSNLNAGSSLNNQYGLFEHYYGLSTGLLLGISSIRYFGAEPQKHYFQFGMDMRLLHMNDAYKVTGQINTMNPYYVIIDGNHFSMNPKFTIGSQRRGKILFGVYAGLGASLRISSTRKVESCFNSNQTTNCNQNANYITSPNGGPTIHLGMLFGLRTRKKVIE